MPDTNKPEGWYNVYSIHSITYGLLGSIVNNYAIAFKMKNYMSDFTQAEICNPINTTSSGRELYMCHTENLKDIRYNYFFLYAPIE